MFCTIGRPNSVSEAVGSCGHDGFSHHVFTDRVSYIGLMNEQRLEAVDVEK